MFQVFKFLLFYTVLLEKLINILYKNAEIKKNTDN